MQRCCLASTLRIRATGVGRAARYARLSQVSPALPRYPPTSQGFLALPAICSAAASAVGLRQACLCLCRTIYSLYFQISKLLIYFEYFFIPSEAASGIQRCCLASTLRTSATGVARASRCSRVLQASPASPGIPSGVARLSGVASYMQRCCFGVWLTTSLPLPLSHDLYFKISKLLIYFEYYFVPSGPASGIQRCYLASTLRTSATGFARASRYSRVLQASPASPGIPSSVARLSGVASYMQRCCFGGWFTVSLPPPHDFIELNKYILNITLYRLELQRYTARLFGEHVEDKCYRRWPCRTIFSSFAGISGVAEIPFNVAMLSGVATCMQRCCFGGGLTTSLPLPLSHDLYFQISKLLIYFEYYVTPSGAASGIQRCCLASTLRTSATGFARASRYSRVLQASPASPGIPSSGAGLLAWLAICSAAVPAVGLR